MAEPTKYSIAYEYTGLENQAFGGSAAGAYRSVSKSNFKISGSTSEPIGKILEIDVIHYHSATNSSSSAKKWSLYTQLMASGTTIATSDTVSMSIKGTVVKYTNRITENLPSPEEFLSWTELRIVKGNNRTDSALYWRATKSAPMKIIVYFWSKRDMVEGADPPTISGLTFADSTGAYDHFAVSGVKRMVQGKSDVTITGLYALDERYEYIYGDHTLTLTDSDGDTIYSETLSGDKNFVPEFHVGYIDDGGTLNITYNVTDNADNSVDYTATMTMLPYSPPQITAALVERYLINADDEEEAAEDGEYAWLTFNGTVQSISGKNAWTLICAYNAEGETEESTVTIASGADGQTIQYNRNDQAFAGLVFGADTGWEFDFALTDYFGTVHQIVTIDEAGAIANIYPGGASFGMRGTGTQESPKFENAYPAYFYGGVDWPIAGIQTGTAQLSLSAGSTQNVTVTFAKPFAEAPMVFLTFLHSTSAGFGSCACSVASASATGMTIRGYNNGSVAYNPQIMWLAIGKTVNDV